MIVEGSLGKMSWELEARLRTGERMYGTFDNCTVHPEYLYSRNSRNRSKNRRYRKGLAGGGEERMAGGDWSVYLA